MEDTLKFFLNAKGWQLFLPLFGSMLIMPFLPYHGTGMAVCYFIFTPFYLGWLWAIAATANQKLDPPLRKSTKWMAIGLVYMLVLVAVRGLFPGKALEMPGVFIPMQLSLMFALFYAFKFTAEQFVTLERNKEVSFFDYSGPFFLFFFFPVGVWIIQPRVNKMLGNSDSSQSNLPGQ
jgi:hypothetical protein